MGEPALSSHADSIVSLCKVSIMSVGRTYCANIYHIFRTVCKHTFNITTKPGVTLFQLFYLESSEYNMADTVPL